MNAWMWHALGIEPTNDLKVIKRAYAEKSKEFHPEEHPDAFKRLQMAYKLAIKYAKGENVQEVIFSDVSPETVLPNIAPEQAEDAFDFTEVYVWDDKDISFWDKIEFLMWHPKIRNSYDHWHYFLNLQDSKLVMQSEESRERFIQLLKKQNFIWQPDVLNFFDCYFETKISLVQQLRKRGISKYIPTNTNIYETPDEKNLYSVLWWSVEEKLRHSPELYLKFYFSYALANKERLAQLHKEAHRARSKKHFEPLKKYILIFGFLCLLVYAWFFDRREEQKQEQIKSVIEVDSAEQMEEIFELLEQYNLEPEGGKQ